MESAKLLKIDLDREIVSAIQAYVMSLLNTHSVVFDVEGEAVNEASASPYCKTLRYVSERKDRCHAFSWELSKSTMRFKRPFEDLCPGGLTLISIPVCLDENTVVGAHCVAISNSLRSKFSVCDVADRFRVDAHILWDAVKKTPLVPKPILKVAREQAILATELMSKTLARIYTLRQSEAAIAEKYHSIEEVFKRQKND